jgi:aldehyde dehydrogenase (NAD+)
MDKESIQLALENQRNFFRTGVTFDVDYRIKILKKLRMLILQYEPEIKKALWNDFHKPEMEVIGTETRFVLKELNLAIRKVKKWSRKRFVWTPLVHFLSYSYIKPQPYGQVLVLSPWNYPFQLAFLPMVGALATGNCVVLKASQQVPHTAAVMEKILESFPRELILMIKGDHSVNDQLLSYKFDYIFFTGSSRIGKHVMQKASENLIPVSLELGGKNPCIVAGDAMIDFAARRIAWGKFMNAGQTCICTDYVLIDKKIKAKFLERIVQELRFFYGEKPEDSKDFAHIINKENVIRLSRLIATSEVITGGHTDPENCFIAPTILNNVRPEDPVMQDEIFGPVLPVIEFENFDEVYDIIERNPKPLATYLFTRDKKLVSEFLRKTQSGSAGINETVMQIASPYLPYGGVGNSGMGRYHGKKSFETFSNMRSVLVKSNLFDIPIRYPPYNKFKERVVSLLMR